MMVQHMISEVEVRLARLRALVALLPDLEEREWVRREKYLFSRQLPADGQWIYYTKRDCGCCPNASEVIVVYQRIEGENVHASIGTTLFRRDEMGEFLSESTSWRKELAQYGVPEDIIEKIGKMRMRPHEPAPEENG